MLPRSVSGHGFLPGRDLASNEVSPPDAMSAAVTVDAAADRLNRHSLVFARMRMCQARQLKSVDGHPGARESGYERFV